MEREPLTAGEVDDWLRSSDGRIADIMELWTKGMRSGRWAAEQLIDEGHLDRLLDAARAHTGPQREADVDLIVRRLYDNGHIEADDRANAKETVRIALTGSEREAPSLGPRAGDSGPWFGSDRAAGLREHVERHRVRGDCLTAGCAAAPTGEEEPTGLRALRDAAQDAIDLLSSAYVEAGPDEPDNTIIALRAALGSTTEDEG